MTTHPVEAHQCSDCGLLWVDECPPECLAYRQHYTDAFACSGCDKVHLDIGDARECCNRHEGAGR